MKHRTETTRQVIITSDHFHWRRDHCDESELIFHMDAKLKIPENKNTNTCINFHREGIMDTGAKFSATNQ